MNRVRELNHQIEIRVLPLTKSLIDSNRIYLLGLVPAIIAAPYLIWTDRFSSVSRIVYILLCSMMAIVSLYLTRSPRLSTMRARLAAYTGYALAVAVAAYGLGMFYLAVGIRLNHGMSIVQDVANMEQILWATAHGRWFQSSFYNGSAFSAHFAPIWIPLTAIYAVADNIGVIFALQSLLIASAAFPIYLMLKEATGRMEALVFALTFLITPAVVSQHFNLYLNHFSPFFFWGAIFSYWKSNWRGFVIFSILSASVQEDIAFTLLIFGLLAWLEHRPLRWRLVTVLFPLIWFGIAMYVIQVNSTVTGIALGGNFSNIGKTPGEMTRSILADPGILVQMLFSNPGYKGLWVYELLSPLLFFLPFASPLFLAALPDWLVFSLANINTNPEKYSVAWYYSIFITTILFGSVAYALSAARKQSVNSGLKGRFAMLVMILLFFSNAVQLPLVVGPEMFAVDDGKKWATIQRVAAQLSPDACVITTYDIMQPFARRLNLYYLGAVGDETFERCEYVVVSERLVDAETSPGVLHDRDRSLRDGKHHQLVLDENQIQLYIHR